MLTDYTPFLEVAGKPKQVLNVDVRPQAIHGGQYVGIGSDHEVYLVEVASGHATQITHDGRSKLEVVISEEYIAWLVQAQRVTVHLPGQEEPVALHHIVVYNRRTGEQRQITREPAPRKQLAIDDTRLVWADKRNETVSYSPLYDIYTYDIYGYDLATDTEHAIAVADGIQQSPSIHGDLVVWQDNRLSPLKGNFRAGCGNCPENRFDIYLYDWTIRASHPLVEDRWLKANPVIFGTRVAWEGFTEGLQGDVYLMELPNGPVQRITQTPDWETDARIVKDRLLWTVRKACDVVEMGPDGQPVRFPTGVYVRDLNTGHVRRLSAYVEPSALVSEATAMIVEGCEAGFTAYTVGLE